MGAWLHRIAQESVQRAFGRRLRVLRQVMGPSQEVVALTAELERSSVGQIERRERNVSLVTISKLAYALDLAPHALLLSPGTHHAR